MNHRTPGTPRARRSVRGFMMLEALVAMLIFAIGVLGIVGLQATMTKAQTGSKFRADAAFLAQRLIGSMWADAAHLASYGGASCAGYTRCSQWAAEVAATLPAGSASIVIAAQDVTITINWTPPSEEQRTYVTTSTVSANPAPPGP